MDVSKGDLLTSKSSSYLVEDFLGEGSFGKVARCVETATNVKVAVKIIKNRPSLVASAKQEIHILKRLRALDPERCGIVRWMGHFNHGPHFCLVFELLDQSLQDFAKQTENRDILPLMQIKNIVQQLASALEHLGTLGIIHGDLKLDNVMMTGQDTQVKIIDFGCSLHLSQAIIGYNFGALWYRSPEIMLGLPYSGMVDMWSLGCMTAELLIGNPLYPGDTEYDMWEYIIHTHGELPDAMLDQGIKSHLCFTKGSVWRLKTEQEYNKSMRSTWLRWPRLFPPFTSLEEVVEVGYQPGQPIPPSFTDLLKRMLHLDCDQRITPHALLEHPFISLGREIHTDSSFPEPTVDQPHSSFPEPSVDQPYSRSPEPTVVQPYSRSPEPTVVQPYSSSPEPTMVQPYSSSPEPTMVQPYSSFPGPWSTSVDHHNGSSFPDPSVDQPYSSSPELTLVQPYSSFPESVVVQPCSLPVSHTPSVSEEEKKAKENKDSGKGTASIPTASYGVATETVEVKPAVADIPLDVTPKKKTRGRVKRFFKTVLKSFCCCCCFAHGDLD